MLIMGRCNTTGILKDISGELDEVPQGVVHAANSPPVPPAFFAEKTRKTKKTGKSLEGREREAEQKKQEQRVVMDNLVVSQGKRIHS